MKDLKERLASKTQLTTDGFTAYMEAVEKAFGGGIDYAMLVKNYNRKSQYVGAEKRIITGNPKYDAISTSYVERLNLTLRMQNKRLARSTNAHSKKLENHVCAIGLSYFYYNFCRIHSTLRVTPAMEAGLSDHVWSFEELLSLIIQSAAKKRGPYKPRNKI